jgi:hypothetical protein
MESSQALPAHRTVIADRPAANRARATNKPRRMVISGRTALGRRVRDLADSFAAQLGGWTGLSDTMTHNVRRAAELTALAEQTRADALRDGNLNPLALVRLEGAANRAVRALMLDRKREPPEREQQLADWLARTKRGSP